MVIRIRKEHPTGIKFSQYTTPTTKLLRQTILCAWRRLVTNLRESWTCIHILSRWEVASFSGGQVAPEEGQDMRSSVCGVLVSFRFVDLILDLLKQKIWQMGPTVGEHQLWRTDAHCTPQRTYSTRTRSERNRGWLLGSGTDGQLSAQRTTILSAYALYTIWFDPSTVSRCLQYVATPCTSG